MISSPVIYKFKLLYDQSLNLKACIATHGNEDSKKYLRSDCAICLPVGMRIILSLVSIRRWRLSKIDVKTAFLQTGQAQHDVYLLPLSVKVMIVASAYGFCSQQLMDLSIRMKNCRSYRRTPGQSRLFTDPASFSALHLHLIRSCHGDHPQDDR